MNPVGIAALEHLNGIEDPIRVTDERGNPFLHYSAKHLTDAFKAGATAFPSVAMNPEKMREALERYGQHDAGCPWHNINDARHCSCGFSAALSTPAPSDERALIVALPSVCDGKEQDAFEAWASSYGFDLTTHPLHWLFLDKRTHAARQGWKAAIEYCRSFLPLPPSTKDTSDVG